jgi:Group II intron, maturase-specific domain
VIVLRRRQRPRSSERGLFAVRPARRHAEALGVSHVAHIRPRRAVGDAQPSRCGDPLRRQFVVLCRTRQRAEQARERVAAIVAPLRLHLHPDKTRIVSLAQGGNGFDFWGFQNRLVETSEMARSLLPQQVALHPRHGSIRAKVRERTDRRNASAPMDAIVGYLNPVLRGWATTSRTATPTGSSTPSTCTPSTPGAAGQHQAWAPRHQLGRPVRLSLAPDPRRPPAHRNRRPKRSAKA